MKVIPARLDKEPIHNNSADRGKGTPTTWLVVVTMPGFPKYSLRCAWTKQSIEQGEARRPQKFPEQQAREAGSLLLMCLPG
ncbi:MAG: hypothetical protein LLG42_10315 [Chloroflexi bacterium]|nr:hypothetical protein [Chloroflexota bacterium]